MEEDIRAQLNAQNELLLKIYSSVEKTRKYFLWTLVLSILVFVLPLLGLLFVIPSFLSIYSSALGGL